MSDYKNIVYKSKLTAEGDIHVGDVYMIQQEPKEFFLDLTALPFVAKKEIFGRGKELEDIHGLLDSEDRVLLMNGMGGIGKTTMAKYYLGHYRKEYNHVAWVSSVENIKESFTSDIDLVSSLHLKEDLDRLEKNKKWIDDAFSLIINRMRQLGGNSPERKNLLIIDDASEDIENTKILDQIALRPNWKVLVTSRENLLGFEVYPLGFLAPKDAIDLFYFHYTREKNDDTVKEILALVDYNTLAIEVIAKTGQEMRWELSGLLNRLKKKGWNLSSEEKIKFSHNYNKAIFNVFEYLLEIFEIANLGETELWLLKQFAVLPSFYIPYKDESKENILSLLQIANEDQKDRVTIAINKLVKKGFLQLDKQMDAFNMHNLLQDIFRFKLNPDTAACKDLIQELYARISYQHVDTVSRNNLMVDHLTMHVNGSSVDFSELLDEYASVIQRFYDFPKSIELQNRALKMKLKLLPAMDLKLADSYNSLALAYLGLGEFELALEYQLEDLAITQHHSKEEDYNLAISYNNLSLIYRKLKAFPLANEYQQKAARIAEQINDSDLDNVLYNNLGNLDYLQKNFQSAVKYFKHSLAVRIENKSDQLWISEAHCNLGSAYVEVSEFDLAKKHLDEAYSIEVELVPDKFSFAVIHKSYGQLYLEMHKIDQALYHFEESLRIFLMNFSEEHADVLNVKCWIAKTKAKSIDK